MAEAMNIGEKLQQMADNEGGKRSAEENAVVNQNNKRPRGDGAKVSFRVLIPSSNAGGIIGKEGSNINQLRKKYNATITVPDCSGPERILTVTMEVEAALECIQEIIPLLDENKQNPEHCSVRVLVHQSLAGAIIGKEGCKIKEMREQIGAHIKVYSRVCPNSTDRVVQVGGTPDKVIGALRELQKLISSTPIKGPDQPYDPYCFEPFLALDYGGYTGSDNKKMGAGGGGGMGRNMGYRGGRYGGGGRGMGFDYLGGGGGGAYGGRGMFGHPPLGGLGGGRRGGRGGGGPGGGGGGPGGAPSSGGGRMPEPLALGLGNSGRTSLESLDSTEKTTQVTIPKDCAGAIIGARGCRIRQIRTQSRATIKIEDSKPDSNERIITITGTEEQISYAQYLLQESVRNFSGTKY
ncbi:heterogeneous nuclear ribonucleoprotein K-like isoform X1 [Lytechinus variegatus]|uniref:heterogeneous nuclear ribonucleoprotein K-like isoform X1 n=1 Tax=Lytechinus variegatus TaxID=7654 RepID=UPI001BB1DB4F|nr:heterogeneous nuclear ribonucleoprotein K-like isoform X1 [Lytechinus variegatus]